MSVHRFLVRLSSSKTRRNSLKKWIENSNRSEKELEDAEASQSSGESCRQSREPALSLAKERLALDAAGHLPHHRRGGGATWRSDNADTLAAPIRLESSPREASVSCVFSAGTKRQPLRITSRMRSRKSGALFMTLPLSTMASGV